MNKKGQSIIEYTLIAVFVLLGVYFMGPYVLRSIDAHFKLWDEGVRDSFEENLRQAPVGDVPFINTDCQCNAVQGTCGSNNPGSLCGPNEREMDYSCSIQGCNGAQGNSYCVTDPSCCGVWENLGCGNVPLNEPPPTNNCHYGYRLQQEQCGTNTSIQCVKDSSCPMPSCTGLILIPGSAAYCSTGTGNPPTTGLNQDTPTTYVEAANAGSCPGAQLNQQIFKNLIGTTDVSQTINAATTGQNSVWKIGQPANLSSTVNNFFFYNYQTYGFLFTVVDPQYPGPIIPGASKHHLRMILGGSIGGISANGSDWNVGNNCSYQTINGQQLLLCDTSTNIIEDDSNGLVLRFYDPQGSWHEYQFEILDANYHEIFHFGVGVDTQTSLAFIPYTSSCSTCDGSSPCQAYCSAPTYKVNSAGTACILNNQCKVGTFIFPNRFPGIGGQQCGDQLSTAYAKAVCSAYGFSGGDVHNRQGFSDGPYGNDWAMDIPVASTGGNFNETINGHTATWSGVGGCNSWGNLECNVGSPQDPNPSTIPHSIICENQPLPANTYYTVSSSSCDGITPCQVVCAPGYAPYTSSGPCLYTGSDQ